VNKYPSYPDRFGTHLTVLGLVGAAPNLAVAQTSPFMTGASALQTNILAWLTPVAIILVMVLGAMAMANRKDVEALLGRIDRRTMAWQRDYALFSVMCNTGARVQEVCSLRVADLRLDPPEQARLHGKGNKIRLCPKHLLPAVISGCAWTGAVRVSRDRPVS
jgi:Phage integrase family